ncbi:hypothetical protein VP1G_03827 [Cytospora mali]|uniref:Outer spore wall protein RRT8 n=1 Tax=Cytospora mali TaxID=578113 RepID=A0A194UY23_CYTMA|nr:hypothetical protein VP1G_03827 [Valsa mali var. pyri (nom. inval.)]
MASETFQTRLKRRIQQSRFVDIIHRALRSGWYPLQGIWYFSSHRKFWPLWAGRLLPLSIISLFVYSIVFFFAYLPQVALLAIWQGRGAWVSALVLTLGEGMVLIQALFEGFFVDEARVDVFDATLIDHGLVDLVAPHRLLFPDAPNSVKMLGKPTSHAEYAPWSFVQIIELVVYLPLNFIPIVGAPIYIILTGTRLGKLSHYRWHKLRGLHRREMKAEQNKYTWEFIWFGTVAMVLELVPLLSFFFLLTTTAGCALWVSKLEGKARGWNEESRAEEGLAQAQGSDAQIGPQEASGVTHATMEEDDPPPPYSDNPL